jgi:CelD/BcsL family acetyltransferase involved in cellulose biosynthesis
MAGEKPRWEEIEIKPLDVHSKEFSELVEAYRAAGFVVQTFFSFGNWYLPVNGRSFAEYSQSLPSVLKNTLSRKRKKLEKTGRAKIEIVTGGQELNAAIDAYMKVYRSSWKQPEPYPQFVPGLIRMCAAMGALRLGLIYVDGEPAAAQLWIVHHGNALIYKLAYDERFADLSVGTILSATLFEHALDVDRVSEVDYLSGDDAYKRDWMSQRRERWGILALNPRTPRGLLAIARHVGGRAVKRAAVSLAKPFRRDKSRNSTA